MGMKAIQRNSIKTNVTHSKPMYQHDLQGRGGGIALLYSELTSLHPDSCQGTTLRRGIKWFIIS